LRKGSELVLHNSELVQKLAIILASTAFMQVIFAGWAPRYSERYPQNQGIGSYRCWFALLGDELVFLLSRWQIGIKLTQAVLGGGCFS
jgi:hypothetical protein